MANFRTSGSAFCNRFAKKQQQHAAKKQENSPHPWHGSDTIIIKQAKELRSAPPQVPFTSIGQISPAVLNWRVDEIV